MEQFSAAILAALSAAGQALRPNKLRKRVIAALEREHDEGGDWITWSNFASSLDALVEQGRVLRDEAEDGTLQCYLPGQAAAVQHQPAKEGASAGAGGAVDSSMSSVMGKEAGTMQVPSQFVPFLLRQKGEKLNNIQRNTKTRIQVDRRAGGGSLATIHIHGNEQKHVKAAVILIEKMLAAFERKNSGGGKVAAEGEVGGNATRKKRKESQPSDASRVNLKKKRPSMPEPASGGRQKQQRPAGGRSGSAKVRTTEVAATTMPSPREPLSEATAAPPGEAVVRKKKQRKFY